MASATRVVCLMVILSSSVLGAKDMPAPQKEQKSAVALFSRRLLASLGWDLDEVLKGMERDYTAGTEDLTQQVKPGGGIFRKSRSGGGTPGVKGSRSPGGRHLGAKGAAHEQATFLFSQAAPPAKL